jgi:hypothetical protein
MSTYEKIGDEGWRKCWVCGTRMYSVKGKLADETLAPTHAWVDVDLSDGVLVCRPYWHCLSSPSVIPTDMRTVWV